MRRRRSTRSVIKLLAAAAVATVSIVSLGRLSTPPARGELPLCEDIEEIDTNVLIKPPKQGNAPEQLMDFLKTYKNEHRPGDESTTTTTTTKRSRSASGRSSTGSFCPRGPYCPRALESPGGPIGESPGGLIGGIS